LTYINLTGFSPNFQNKNFESDDILRLTDEHFRYSRSRNFMYHRWWSGRAYSCGMMNYLSGSQPQQQRDGNNKTKRRPGTKALRETQPAINIQSISIPSIRNRASVWCSHDANAWYAEFALGAAREGGRARKPRDIASIIRRQTAISAHAALSALERRNFERNYRCTHSHVRNRCTKRP